jgi:hypothetical protein
MFQLIMCNSPLAQEKKRPDFALSPGIVFQNQTFGEINILVGRYESSTGGNAFGGIRVGLESNLKTKEEHIYAPKIGVELSGMLMCIRGTVLSYINADTVQLRLLPEAGFSYLGFANLTYGYNFQLSKADIAGISKHRIALSININRDLISDAFTF